MSSLSIAILACTRPDLTAKMLESLEWSGRPDIPIRMFVDKSPAVGKLETISTVVKHTSEQDIKKEGLIKRDFKVADIKKMFFELGRKYNIEVFHSHDWHCIQGNAQLATIYSPEDWILFLTEDILMLPGFMDSIIKTIQKYDDSSAGLFALSFVDCLQELVLKRKLLIYRDELFDSDNTIEKLDKLNKQAGQLFWKPPWVISYCVHGTAFIMRRKMWEMCGGYSQYSWMWDHDISMSCWMYTPYNIFLNDSPPLIHRAGGSVSVLRWNPGALPVGDPGSADLYARWWTFRNQGDPRYMALKTQAYLEATGATTENEAIRVPIEKCKMRKCGVLLKPENKNMFWETEEA